MTPPRRAIALGAAITLLCTLPVAATGQSSSDPRGTTGHTAAGAMLGVYSGATLGLLGSMYPCSRSHLGRRCAVSVSSAGAALGLAMGGTIGFQDRFGLEDRFYDAGYGVAAGAATGLVLASVIDRYTYWDALVLGWVGGAIGAGGEGALYGLGIGAGVGAIAWGLIPRRGVQDAVLVALVGLAVGGLYDFGRGAANKPVRNPFGASFSIPF